MAARRCLQVAFAAGHLGVVICGAAYLLPDADAGPIGQTVRWYGAISGADSTYGFFAPNVGSVHRARFQLRDGEGVTWWDSFDEGGPSEARLRLNGIVDAAFMDGEAYEQDELRQPLVRSWAAMMFRRHPRATSLTVVVEFYGIPDMADYRAGSCPGWEEIYRARIQREPRADPDGSAI